MAPSIASTSIRSDSGNTTNHTGTMPPGVVSGNLIIANLSMDGNTTLGWPAGWTVLSPITNSGGDGTSEVRYRIADGSEAGHIVVTTPASEACSFAMYRITDWHGTTPPEAGTPNTGSSQNPDAPSLSPSWGAEDNLYIFIAAWGSSISNIDANYPANYTLSQLTDSVGNSNIPGIAMAARQLAASSDDPGAATLGASSTWVANTLVVRPAGGVSNIIHPIFANDDLHGALFGGQVVQ